MLSRPSYAAVLLIFIFSISSTSHANSCIKDPRFQRELKPCVCESFSDIAWTCQSTLNVDITDKFETARFYLGSQNLTSFQLHIRGTLSNPMQITSLTEGTFDNFIFENNIAITTTTLQRIHVNAFRTSAPTTKFIILSHNQLVNSDDSDYDIFRVIGTFTSLVQINLQNNKLNYVPSNAFTGLKSLRSVLLSNNYINVLGENSFIGSPLIDTLRLDSNKLSTLPKSFFAFQNGSAKLDIDLRMNNLNGRSFPSLETLNRPLKLRLWRNNITILDESTFSKHLQSNKNSEIDVRANYFECGCEMQWLLERDQGDNHNFKFRNQVFNLKCPGGDSIWDWSLQDFSNCVHNDIIFFPLLRNEWLALELEE